MNLPTFGKKILPVIFVLLIAVIAIFWNLGKAPSGVLVDEASLGYNAYSVLQTGKDEWGDSFPLTLKSFGDYKPSGYIYFAIPFIKLLGLSPLSIRLPSAFAGLLSVLLVYLIIRSLTKNNLLSFICALILASSGWLIYMSRMAWEANVSLTLFLGGIYFLINSNKKILFLILSAFFLSLSLYVYVGYKILTPLFLIFFSYYFYRNKLLDKKSLKTYFIIFLIFCLPFLYETVYKGAATRFSQVNVFNQAGTSMFINEQRAFCGMQNNKTLLSFCYLFWNKATVTLTDFTKKYLANFSTDFLFFTGDSATFINNPDHGGLPFWLLPFFIIGIIEMLRNWNSSNYQLILLWLLISPIMPSLAGKPHFVRSNMLLIPVVIICGVGVLKVIEKLSLKNNFKKIVFTSFFTLILLTSLAVLMVDYLFIYTKKAMAWDEYYLDIYKYLKTADQDYDVISIKKFNKHPYIYQLFYQSIDPKFFEDNVVRDKFEVLSVGKYKYVEADFKATFCLWQQTPQLKTLYVTNEVKENYDPILVISSFNKVHPQAAIYDFERTQKFLASKEIDTIICKQ